MPSNYTIAKTLKQVAYYREICGREAGKYVGSAMEVQSLRGKRLDELVNPDAAAIQAAINEADADVSQTILELIRSAEVTALKADVVPLSILEVTEIKGIGGKMARRAYDELQIVDLAGLQAAARDGRLSKVKGFGPTMIAKVLAHGAKAKGKE